MVASEVVAEGMEHVEVVEVEVEVTKAEALAAGPTIVLRTDRDALSFFQEFVASEEPMDLLKSVLAEGRQILKKATTLLDYKKSDCRTSFIAFLEKITSDDAYVGLSKEFIEDALCDVYLTMGLLGALTSGLRDRRYSAEDLAVLVWFVKIVLNSDPKHQAERDLAPFIAELKAQASGGLRKQIQNLVVTGSWSSDYEGLDALKSLVPLHDNDHPDDFRKIQIVPTISELNATTSTVYRDWMGDPEDTAAKLVDRHFRLLREDMLDPLREEINEVMKGKGRARIRFSKPRVAGVETKGEKCSLLVYFNLPGDILQHIDSKAIQSKKKQPLLHFFENEGSKLLPVETVLLFFGADRVEHFGIVSNCIYDFDYKDVTPAGGKTSTLVHMIIRVAFENSSLPAILKHRGEPFAEFFVKARATIFSFYPVLKCLQGMMDIPLAEELVFESPSKVEAEERLTLPTAVGDALKADPSQLMAAEDALSRRVSIIQGPPGTGKTYVGIQIVKALLRTMPDARILCLCYTNHALDSFLESLLDNGVRADDMIRFGSLSRISERIKSRSYQGIDAPPFSGNSGRLHFAYKSQRQEVEYQIREVVNNLLEESFRLWSVASNFLEAVHYEDYSQLSVDDHLADEFGMKLVGKGGKSITKDYLWKEWLSGHDLPAAFKGKVSMLNGENNLWNLNHRERIERCKIWEDEYMGKKMRLLNTYTETYSNLSLRHANLKEESKMSVVDSVRILACTSTYAAKSRSLIDSFCPNVLLVEEAAELHESHILTNVSSRIKHLIMIGDHMQLRPKLQSYTLKKESGNRIDFDVSLFERLVLGGYPYTTLQVQHRMRPEISSLIKCTYPDLQDHTTTLNRNDIRGVAKNVVFVDHRQPEAGGSEESLLVDTSSKYNEHEVNMLLKIARYLLQQGYQGKDIVILTPYLGQLMLLKKTMKKFPDVFKVEMGDRDEQDVANLDGDEDQDEAQAKQAINAPQIRIATIDNYQGEESKIVLASLVRSNDRKDIGFVSTAERVNVLMSRARDGLILIGNSETYRKAASRRGREVWGNVFRVLDDQNAVYDGFPAKCTIHKSVQLLKMPGDFDAMAPYGGCSMPCNASLPLCPKNHLCSMLCHPRISQDHSKIKCSTLVDCQCKSGVHTLKKECHSSNIPVCHTIVDLKCAAGHISSYPCSSEQRSLKCKFCAKLAKEKTNMEERQRKEMEKMQQETAQLEEESNRVHQDLSFTKDKLDILRKQELLKENIKIGQEIVKSSREEMEEIKRRKGKAKIAEPEAVSNSSVVRYTKKELEDIYEEESAPLNPAALHSSPDVIQASKQVSECSKAEVCGDGHASLADRPPHPLKSPLKLSEIEVEIGSSVPATPRSPANQTGSPLVKPLKSAVQQSNLNYPGSDHSPNVLVARKNFDKLLQSYLSDNWIDAIKLVGAIHSQITVEQLANSSTPSYPYPVDTVCIYLLCCQKLSQDKKGQLVLCISALDNAMSLMGSSNIPLSTGGLSKDYLSLLHHYSAAMIYSSDTNLKCLTLKHANDFIWILSKDSAGIANEHPWGTVWRERMQSISAAATSSQSKKVEADANNAQQLELKTRWKEKILNAKRNEAAVPEESMSSLLDMTGLQSVKQKFVDIFDMVQMIKEQGMTLSNKNFNTRFDGNPGTGKTTVAKLFMKFMTEVGVLPKSCEKFLLKTGSELANNGVSQLTKDLEELKKQGGGVILVDEAYQLNDSQGHRILDFILGHSERMSGEFGNLIWIFAGYKSKMDDLFKHNVGLPSRFPNVFEFEDYSDDELLSIFQGIMKRGGSDVVTKGTSSTDTKPTSSKPVSLNMNNYNNELISMYGRGQYRGSPEVDQWGNTWYWDSANFTYYDDFDNITGMGVSGLGSLNNPLVSRSDNIAWIWDAAKKHWYNRADPSRISSTYPGKPVAPIPETSAKKPFSVTDEKWLRIAIRRLGRQRGVVGFGNARAVRNLFDLAHSRQVRRTTELRSDGKNPDIFTFDRSDLLGPKATMENLESCEAWQELQRMEGLKSVKQSLRQLLNLVITNADREEQEKKLLDTVLNRIFLGNPGTGKTTVAKLYGRILASI
eukprot:gene26332-31809_t